MKKHFSLLSIGLVVVFAVGLLWAQEDGKPARIDKDKLLRERTLRGKSEEQTKQMDRGMMRKKHLDRLEKEIGSKKKRHTEFIGELKAIKELALKEGAKKTAKRLDTLIDAKNKEFSETIGSARQMQDRLNEQSAKVSKTPPGQEVKMEKHAESANKSDKEEEDTKEAEGKGKWWKFWK